LNAGSDLKPNRRPLMLGAAGLTALAGGSWFGLSRQGQHANSDLGNDAAAINTLFGLSFDNPQGESIAMAQYRGKPLVLNFWATWCPPCVEEMPELSEWYRSTNNSVSIVGIGIDSPSNVREFTSKNKISYPLLVAGMGGTELSRILGNASGALPFTIIISSKQSVALRVLGRFSLSALKTAVKSA
jgi:thiol-disulfide isomerase/thioredoxin